MKRLILYYATAALAVLSSCSKTELDSEKNPREISFSTVKGSTTKSPLSGTVYKTTDPSFGVFCYALTSGKTWAADSADGQTYMDKLEISYVDADKIWEPASPYYWPLSGTLTFVGFSPYSEAGKVAYAPATKRLTVTDYVCAATSAAQTDLMWSTTQKDLSDNQSTYTSESATSTLEGVNMVFHHALSQVKFTVKKASADLDDYTITVTGLTFNANSKGTLTVTDDSGVWSAQGTAMDFDTEVSDLTVPNSGSTAAAAGVTNMPVPQALTAGTQKFIITYTLAKGGVDLGSKTVTLDLLTATVNEWVSNTIYTYDLLIGLNKIYFNPTMVDWVDADPQPSDINVN